MSTVDEVRVQALGLSSTERATLARDLLLSLESPDFDEDADSAWAAEIEARSAAFARGELTATPWRESVARMKEALVKRPSP